MAWIIAGAILMTCEDEFRFGAGVAIFLIGTTVRVFTVAVAYTRLQS